MIAKAGSANQFLICPARTGDLAELQRIETAAGQLFRSVGMTDVANHDPTSIKELEEACEIGLLITAVCEGRLAGLAVAGVVDGNFHIEEMSVHPAFMRRGIGTALVASFCAQAKAQSHPWVTLRTFRDIPWNAPFYARIGFNEIPEAARTPGLIALIAEETERGLDPDRRLFMRRRP